MVEATLTVRPLDDGIEIRLGKYSSIAEHWRGETFYLDWERIADSNAFLTFDVSPRGDVSSLRLDWGGMEMEFTRADTRAPADKPAILLNA